MSSWHCQPNCQRSRLAPQCLPAFGPELSPPASSPPADGPGPRVVEKGPAAVAATFTSNAVVAAPVRLSRAHLNGTEVGGAGRFGWTDAIVATAGSANAATGPEGDVDQVALAQAVATALGTRPERTLALSTGVIGVRLPILESWQASTGWYLNSRHGTKASRLSPGRS